MVIIRLAKYGKRNDPFFRIVATEHKNKIQGEYLENLGYWHPKSKQMSINKDGITSWTKKGAQISRGVSKLLA